MTRIAEKARRDEFNDAYECGVAARKCAADAERAIQDAELFHKILTECEQIMPEVKRLAQQGVSTMRAEAGAKMALHDSIFSANRTKPGFADGYEAGNESS